MKAVLRDKEQWETDKGGETLANLGRGKGGVRVRGLVVNELSGPNLNLSIAKHDL